MLHRVECGVACFIKFTGRLFQIISYEKVVSREIFPHFPITPRAMGTPRWNHGILFLACSLKILTWVGCLGFRAKLGAQAIFLMDGSLEMPKFTSPSHLHLHLHPINQSVTGIILNSTPKNQSVTAIIWNSNPKNQSVTAIIWNSNPKNQSVTAIIWYLNPINQSVTAITWNSNPKNQSVTTIIWYLNTINQSVTAIIWYWKTIFEQKV